MANPEYTGTTSASLLLRVRDLSDERSWHEFQERYGELILRYCRQRGLQQADSEDVRQQVWINLAKGMRNFAYDPSRGRFRHYLGCVARNAIARHVARYGSREYALDAGVLASASNGNGLGDEIWEQEWVDHHYRLAMQTVIATFEPRSVTLFNRLLAGEKAADLAKKLGMTPAAVNQVKHRIRERMKELIALQVLEEDDPELYGRSEGHHATSE